VPVFPAGLGSEGYGYMFAAIGVGGLLVEILAETGLQRALDEEVFGRAYGLAIPASYGGIAAGSLLAPVLITAFGTSRPRRPRHRWIGRLVTGGGRVSPAGRRGAGW
jgi:hypothetical protein